MSEAAPMPTNKRIDLYTRQVGRSLTPRQSRRLAKKDRRASKVNYFGESTA